MADFHLHGNGTSTSSAAITEFDLGSPAIIPEPYSRASRAVVHTTESGMVHAYSLGQDTRQWQVGLRLLTAAQMRALETIYNTLGQAGWCLWYIGGGAADATSTTAHLDDLASTPLFAYTDQWKDYVIISYGGGSGPPAGETRRITDSDQLTNGHEFTVDVAWSAAPTTDTIYVWGTPVRFMGGLRWQSVPPNLFNVDFTLEEYLTADTV